MTHPWWPDIPGLLVIEGQTRAPFSWRHPFRHRPLEWRTIGAQSVAVRLRVASSATGTSRIVIVGRDSDIAITSWRLACKPRDVSRVRAVVLGLEHGEVLWESSGYLPVDEDSEVRIYL